MAAAWHDNQANSMNTSREQIRLFTLKGVFFTDEYKRGHLHLLELVDGRR